LVKAVERVAVAGAISILFGGVFFTPQLVLRENAPAARVEAPLRSTDTRPAAFEPGDDRASEVAEGFTDLYGNEVSDAIATYSIDQSGSLYELHSPQTELPRLGSPKS
jgi:hypothetical protein